jgi:hypothetical protein
LRFTSTNCRSGSQPKQIPHLRERLSAGCALDSLMTNCGSGIAGSYFKARFKIKSINFRPATGEPIISPAFSPQGERFERGG